MSAKVTAPLLLVTLIFPAFGGWLEDRLRSAPVLGIGRFVVPSEAGIDDLLRDGQPRLEGEVDEYLRDPGAFLAAREHAGLLDRLGSLRDRLLGLFRDGGGGVRRCLVWGSITAARTARRSRPRSRQTAYRHPPRHRDRVGWCTTPLRG